MIDNSGSHRNAEQQEQHQQTRSRLVLVSFTVPLLIVLASAVLIVSWIPSLPAQIAIHWGASGVDGYGSPWVLIAIMVGTVVVFGGALAFSLADFALSGRPRPMHKLLAVTSLWLAVTLAVGMATSVATQRGLSDASAAPDPATGLLVGAVSGLLVAVAAWFCLPKADRTPPRALDVESLHVAPSERAFWTGKVSVSRPIWLTITAVLVLVVIGTVLASMTSMEQSFALIALLVFLIAAAALTTLRWRVSVGPHGFAAVSFAGWPSLRIRLADVAEVRLITVNPIGDFGGWGWRWANGRTGIILQGGAAIEVTRRNGKVLVVPIGDAEMAVAVLQAAIAQQDGA